MYHHIGDPPPGVKLWALYVSRLNFSFQMWYLKTFGYNVVSLQKLFEDLEAGRELPPYTVALTFDDGFADFYQNALPVLKKYALPASVFMVTGQAGENADWEDIALTGTGRLMNEGEIREASSLSRISFYPHTATHKKLSKLTKEEAAAEVKKSLDAIESLTGSRPPVFAAPYGDYNSETLSALRECGIKYAVGTDNRAVVWGREPLLELPRVIVRRNNHIPGFIYKMFRIFKNGK
ncbi:MAG TPA: polysaccharide deacetylase family protein [Candidatus Wallbacteria bacterium]|nr:polysaccharide deacetylase family protein [Candidatus Wallbacteria bacterium]